MPRPVLIVGPSLATASTLGTALRGLPVRLATIAPSDSEGQWNHAVRRVVQERGCVVLDAELGDADLCRLSRAAAALGASVVLPRDVPEISPSDPGVDCIFRAHALAIEPAFLALLHEARQGTLGLLERVVVRVPAGRRLPRAGSTRTAFADRARGPFELSAGDRTRLAARWAEAWAMADALAPGVGTALEVTELCADASSGDRLVAHALARGLAVELELDAEMLGEGPIEIEARCTGGELVARWGRAGCALVRRSSRGVEPVAPSEPSALAATVRHVLARSDEAISPISLLGQSRAQRLLEQSLGRAAERVRSRPLGLVLVHLPRLRHALDALHMPSLAVARLAAFMRAHGFVTEVVDLEAEPPMGRAERGAFDRPGAPVLDEAEPPALCDAAERLWSRLEPAIAKAKARNRECLVGFSVTDFQGHFQLAVAASLARRAKSRASCTTVLGGERDQVGGLAAPGLLGPFDYAVEGDGEIPLLGLCHLHAYADRRASDVPGLWLGRDHGARERPRPVRSHLNAMPCPDFGGVPLDRYRALPSVELLRLLQADGLAPAEPPEPFGYLPYSFVKGCPGRCAFCSAKEHLDVQRPEKSVDELLQLSARHGIRDLVFLNNLVNVGPRYLERFCRLLIDARAGLQWTDSCRPTGITDDLAAAMREAGCLLLNFGVESGSDAVLTRMRKGFDAASIVRTLRATHRAGILNRVNLIAGYLHERPDDVDHTLRLVDTLHEQIDLIGCFQGFYLFPGMQLAEHEAGITLRAGTDRLVSGQLTLAYDEIGGLRWEEKRKAIEATRLRILERIEALGIRTEERIREHDLFYLGRRFDKATLKRYLFASWGGV